MNILKVVKRYDRYIISKTDNSDKKEYIGYDRKDAIKQYKIDIRNKEV